MTEVIKADGLIEIFVKHYFPNKIIFLSHITSLLTRSLTRKKKLVIFLGEAIGQLIAIG